MRPVKLAQGFMGTLKEHTRGLIMTLSAVSTFGLSRPLLAYKNN